MYHPSRGGVRGGRDQFSWDEVKADKHRENYLGHSIKAPVGRWQKGKDLYWYTRDKNEKDANLVAAKEEVNRIKEEEARAMNEILGLAPKRASRPQGNRLDKREAAELFKKGTSAEDLAPGYAEGERVQGLGFVQAPHHSVSERAQLREFQQASSDKVIERENESCAKSQRNEVKPQSDEQEPDSDKDDRENRKKRRIEDKKRTREEKKAYKRDKRNHESDFKRDKRRHESDLHSKHKRRRHDSDDSD